MKSFSSSDYGYIVKLHDKNSVADGSIRSALYQGKLPKLPFLHGQKVGKSNATLIKLF